MTNIKFKLLVVDVKLLLSNSRLRFVVTNDEELISHAFKRFKLSMLYLLNFINLLFFICGFNLFLSINSKYLFFNPEGGGADETVFLKI